MTDSSVLLVIKIKSLLIKPHEQEMGGWSFEGSMNSTVSEAYSDDLPMKRLISL